jgi:molybdopterin synthase sulfur carrier subunit
MARVELTSNLARHLDCPAAEAPGATLREVLDGYFAAYPRSRRYILDDQGGLRRHMIAFVGDRPAKDRVRLSDPVAEGQTVFIFQALSGG